MICTSLQLDIEISVNAMEDPIEYHRTLNLLSYFKIAGILFGRFSSFFWKFQTFGWKTYTHTHTSDECHLVSQLYCNFHDLCTAEYDYEEIICWKNCISQTRIVPDSTTCSKKIVLNFWSHPWHAFFWWHQSKRNSNTHWKWARNMKRATNQQKSNWNVVH